MIRSSRAPKPSHPEQKNLILRSHISPSSSQRKSTRTLVKDPQNVVNPKISPSKTFKIATPPTDRLQPSAAGLIKPKPAPSIPPPTGKQKQLPPPSQEARARQPSTSTTASTPPRRLHPPGYEWDRHGRARELRIRALARKFFALWLARVYGRVSPTRARQHHHRRLLVQMLGEWYSRDHYFSTNILISCCWAYYFPGLRSTV